MKRLAGSLATISAVVALFTFTSGSAASSRAARKPEFTLQSASRRPCVLRSNLAGPIVRDDGRVYFRGQPDPRHSYIAVFKGVVCRKLNPLASLSVEPSGDLVCEGDRIQAVISASQIPAPACIIDHLAPFSGDIDDPVPENLQE